MPELSPKHCVDRGSLQNNHATPTGQSLTASSAMGSHLESSSVVLVFYCAALILGLGHHLFYIFLDGKPAEDQSWNFRAGTAFAVASKISLASAVATAFSQRIWSTVRCKFFSLSDLDSLFTATSDPTSLLRGSLLSNAKIAMLLAVLVWMSPLVSVLAPGSLSTVLSVSTSAPPGNIYISNFNFSRDLTVLGGDDAARAVQFVDTEGEILNSVGGETSPTPGYNKPSNRALAIIYETAYGGRVVEVISPCSPNCTFTQSFVGPSYNCAQLDQYEPDAPWCDPKIRNTTNDPRTCEEVIGEGRLPDPGNVTAYEARNSSANFCVKYVGRPEDGCFWRGTQDEWQDGTLWVRHRYLPPELRNELVFTNSMWQNYTFKCEQWDTKFDLRRTYVNSQMQFELNTTYLKPIKYGPVISSYLFSDGYNGNSSYWPSYAIHDTLYSILAGEIGLDGVGNPMNTAQLEGTKLVEDIPFPLADKIRQPRQNLRQLVEELHINVTLSLLSVSNLPYLETELALDVVQTGYAATFRYNRRALLLTYGIAMALGLLAVLIGLKSLFDNGVSMKSGFLSILTTTRSLTLDELAHGTYLGAEPMPEGLQDVKVRFGEIVGNDGVLFARRSTKQTASQLQPAGGHTAFGLEEEVRDIQYKTPYS